MTQHVFWVTMFISFCVVSSRILTSENSCPCRPYLECPADSLQHYANRQIVMLPCESENLIRCCSTVARAIESVDKEESLQNVDREENWTEETTRFTENTTDFTYFDDDIETLGTVLPSSEESSMTTETFDTTPTNPEDLETTALLSTTENIVTSTTTKKSLLEHQLGYPYSRRFSTISPISGQTLNKNSTRTLSSTVRLYQREKHVRQQQIKKENTEFSADIDEQKLIDEVTSFQSVKISKLRAVPFERKESTFEKVEKSVEEAVKPSFLRNRIVDKNYLPKIVSSPKSVVQKMSNLLKRKSSLDTLVTLDRVSTEAINENSKPSGKLDILRNDNTSIRNFTHPEDIRNIKNVV